MDRAFEAIPGRYGVEIERTADASVSARVPLVPSTTTRDGALRSCAMWMAVDMACGMAAGLGSLPAWSVTADIEFRRIADCRRGPLRVDARCIRSGRKMAIAEARLVDEGDGDRLVALATANHGVLKPDFDPPVASMRPGERHAFEAPSHSAEESLEPSAGATLASK